MPLRPVLSAAILLGVLMVLLSASSAAATECDVYFTDQDDISVDAGSMGSVVSGDDFTFTATSHIYDLNNSGITVYIYQYDGDYSDAKVLRDVVEITSVSGYDVTYIVENVKEDLSIMFTDLIEWTDSTRPADVIVIPEPEVIVPELEPNNGGNEILPLPEEGGSVSDPDLGIDISPLFAFVFVSSIIAFALIYNNMNAIKRAESEIS